MSRAAAQQRELEEAERIAEAKREEQLAAEDAAKRAAAQAAKRAAAEAAEEAAQQAAEESRAVLEALLGGWGWIDDSGCLTG